MLETINRFIWGGPTLLLILGAGAYIALCTGFIQLRWLPKALRCFLSKNDSGAIDGASSSQAMWTALAATVGTGNLAGVAGAIAIGGPGAIFWMWISGILGMGLKFAEATLSVHYSAVNNKGERVAGPMYLIKKGLPHKLRWLASIYCLFGVLAAFGVGNATQINTLVLSVDSVLRMVNILPDHKTHILIGCICAILVAFVLVGGAKRIGRAAERLVPIASALYVVLAMGILLLRADQLPAAFMAIFRGAFSPKAVTGGAVGSLFQTLRIGVSRGVFTNEAGMGTAGIAHGAAKVDHGVQQGLMGVVEVFIDTIVICTMTALVILCSGTDIPFGIEYGIGLTADAFCLIYGDWVQVILALCICCFAFATILGWGLYGVRCAQFLLGEKAWTPFVILQVGTVLLGAVLRNDVVWQFAEIVNGLMAIPNLIAILYLTPTLRQLISDYKQIY